MTQDQHSKLEDSELVDGLFEIDARDVIVDFGGHSNASFRKLLAETGSTMDLMFTYSIISGKGLVHFLSAIDDYARSSDSESDCEFPGSFAHAIQNQVRINPAAVIAVRDQIDSLSQWLLENLSRFDQGDEWLNKTAEALAGILDFLRRDRDAEQAGPSDGDEPSV